MGKDLRTLDMQVEAVGVVSTAFKTISVPDDCLELQSVRILLGGIYKEIHPMPPERLADKDAVTYFPVGYVRVGSVLYVIGGNVSETTSLQYSLLYFQEIPALSDVPTIVSAPGGGTTTVSNETNWLITKEPGLYLYATLIETAPYLKDDGRTLVWAQQYQSILDAIKRVDDRARYGNAPARTLPRLSP